VARLEPVAQHERAAQADDLDFVRRVAALVVALDHGNLDAQQPPLADLTI
jgi:hypothetical protein